MHNIHKPLFAVLAAAGTVSALLSCSTNAFNEDDYNKIVDYTSPVDSVDPNHTWQMTIDRTYTVKASPATGAVRVYLLTENPLTSSQTEIMAQADISDGEEKTLKICTPGIQTQYYAALLDNEGTYTVKAFGGPWQEVNFEEPLARKQRLQTPTARQTMTYCFEEEFPEPGDYDYNDCVLRISTAPGKNEHHLKVSVELSAVGAEKQLAAGIRLVGIPYSKVDSVTTDGGHTFDDGLPTEVQNIWQHKGLRQEARNHEAVIRLFEDAHWATGDPLTIANGIFDRKKYNVARGSSQDYQMIATRTITYNVYFDDTVDASNIILSQLDPFIIEPYNGTFFEVHSYEYRAAQVMYEYSIVNVKNLPWALKIPNGTFRYPLESINIGFIRKDQDGDDVRFGAYMTVGHSFGDWARDKAACQDWYNYPNSYNVY